MDRLCPIHPPKGNGEVIGVGKYVPPSSGPAKPPAPGLYLVPIVREPPCRNFKTHA